MFTKKRSDTLVGTIEETYGVDLNARADMLLGNLLEDRGFDSLSQLLDAYRSRLQYHPRKRRIFLSFHAEDVQQINGFRLLQYNDSVALDFADASIKTPINSANSSYIKQVIAEKIRACSIVVCLIGNGTAWRDWVDWELNKGLELGKGLCGVRLKGSYGRAPELLKEIGAPVARWDMNEITAAIECAAARRS